MKKLYKIIFFVCAIIAVGNTAKAQQDARYSMYMFNGLLLNPAYTGSHEALGINAFYRTQWVGFDGAPQTLSFSVDAPIATQKMGVGGYVEYDQIGVHQRINAYATYAYRIKTGEKSHLAAGIQGGVLHIKSNYNQINSPDGTPADLALNQSQSNLIPNFGLGLYFHTPNFYIGGSVPHLLQAQLNKNAPDGITKLARQYRQYIATAGVVLPLGSNFKVKPSVLVKTLPGNAPTQVDANLGFLIKEVLWLGSSLRFDDTATPESVNAMAAFQLKNGLRIGYAYDYTLSEIQNYTSGSHEVTVGFDVPSKKDRLITPRYF